MEKHYKKVAKNMWLDRAHARRISRELKGSIMVTQVNHVSQTKVKEYDCFDLQVFHPDAFRVLTENMKIDKNQFKDG